MKSKFGFQIVAVGKKIFKNKGFPAQKIYANSRVLIMVIEFHVRFNILKPRSNNFEKSFQEHTFPKVIGLNFESNTFY